jgi:hypothetical protein
MVISFTEGGLTAHYGSDLLLVLDIVLGTLDCVHSIAMIEDGASHFKIKYFI